MDKQEQLKAEEIKTLRMKTEDDFIEEVANVKLKNLNLMDQLEKMVQKNNQWKEKYEEIE